MKRVFAMIIIHSFCQCITFSQQHIDIALHFDPSSFWLNESRTNIETTSHTLIYLADTLKPAIPYIPVQIMISDLHEYSGFSCSCTRQFFYDNVALAPNPLPEPTNNHHYSHTSRANFSLVQYPENNIIFTGENNYGSYKVLNFLVAPWIYNTSQNKLEILTSVNLNIKLETVKTIGSLNMKDSPLLPYLNVVNKDKGICIKENKSQIEQINGNRDDIVEYIIVTRDSLKNSFLPLKQWKKQKGIHSKIFSIEEIDTLYSGSTIQLKIKNCLYDHYLHYGLKYVLLGGDDTVVPVQRCYSIVNRYFPDRKREDNTIPSDLFYSCFSGQFDWNANGNDTIAEVEDGVDFAQYIYVTRLPVRSTQHVTNTIQKILNYEKFPTKNGWNNNILMCGNQLWDTCLVSPRMSDAQAKSENLYRQAIQPYWHGERLRFYDTYTDFPDSSDYQLNALNLQTELGKGYTFMQMATHGSQTSWKMESSPYFYNSNYASQLSNNKPTIITTMACLTNAFDNSIKGGFNDPCLSEAFIRNPNSGVVAYLGCSREGWGSNSQNGYLGPSFQYEKEYYTTLFSSIVKDKNFGKIVSIAKSNKIPSSNYEGAARWVQLGLNPIGDPEMPVFTETPLSFSQCSITHSDSCSIITVGEDSCKVCIMSIDDDGQSFFDVYENTNNICVAPSTHTLQVCITKQNYIPMLFLYNPSTIFIQNEVLKDNHLYKGNRIYVGTAVTDYKEHGGVTVLNGNVTLNANEVILYPETTIEKGAVLNIINDL